MRFCTSKFESACGEDSLRFWSVCGLTVTWWVCAIGVTVLLKSVLVHSSSGSYSVYFPFPLTLTCLSNLVTGIMCTVFCCFTGLPGYRKRCEDVQLKQTKDTCTHVQPYVPHDYSKMIRTPSQQALLRHGDMSYKDANEFGRLSSVDSTSSNVTQSTACTSADGSVEKQLVDESLANSQNANKEISSKLEITASTSCCWKPNSLGKYSAVIGMLQGLSLVAKNEALLFLSVSSRTFVFATNVLVVMFVASVCRVEPLSNGKLIAAMLLAIGGILQGLASLKAHRDHATTDEPFGFCLAILALILDALRWVLLQATFSDRPQAASHADATRSCNVLLEKDHHVALHTRFRVVADVMLWSLPPCFVLAVAFEPGALAQIKASVPAISLLALALSVGVLGINVAEIGVVQMTSAVTFNVLAQVHSIPLVFAGVVFFGDRVGIYKVIGFGICLVGAIIYSFLKAREKSSPDAIENVGSGTVNLPK